MRSNALAVKLKNAGKMTPFVAVAVAQVALAIAILTTINAQADPLAPSASEIDDKASAALSRLYSQNAGARALGAKAKDVLVFPDMRSISQSVFLKPHRGYFRNASGSTILQARVVGRDALPSSVFICLERVFRVTLLSLTPVSLHSFAVSKLSTYTQSPSGTSARNLALLSFSRNGTSN